MQDPAALNALIARVNFGEISMTRDRACPARFTNIYAISYFVLPLLNRVSHLSRMRSKGGARFSARYASPSRNEEIVRI